MLLNCKNTDKIEVDNASVATIIFFQLIWGKARKMLKINRKKEKEFYRCIIFKCIKSDYYYYIIVKWRLRIC